ncbi:hypothetical protein H4R23_000999 [Coemansia sp. Cherry 401B]|nr:hypothetical protein H4R23_000999 [Coemansia sp. Cherry 401B]
MLHWAPWRHLRRQVPQIAYRPPASGAAAVLRTGCRRCPYGGDPAVPLGVSLFGAASRRRQLSTSAHSGADRQSLVYSLSVEEQRLVGELRLLAQTGSPAQRGIVWNLYQQIIESGVGAHTLTSDTALLLIEQVAGDCDMDRALTRVASILESITSKRKLTGDEVATVQRIWEHVEEAHDTPAAWKPLVHKNNSKTRDFRDAAATETPNPASLLDTTSVDLSPNDAEQVAQAVVGLRQLLECPPILIDPLQVWQMYRLARVTTTQAAEEQMGDRDWRRLIDYCSSLGRLAGRRLAMQIEVDLAASSRLSRDRRVELILAYAKLGLLEHSQRVYREAQNSAYHDCDTAYFDRGMCRAFFAASRHKEGRAIFDKLSATGSAPPLLYYILIREYVQVMNFDQAFAIFDELCDRAVPLDNRALNTLTLACALDRDTRRASERLATVTACMRSWRLHPQTGFFVGLLKGYHRSGQFEMFDALVARLRTGDTHSHLELDKIVMLNAASRGDATLALAMADLVAQDPASIPAVVQTLCKMGRADYAMALVSLDKLPDNNITANIRLELAISDAKVAINPSELPKATLAMIDRGFTPSFRLARNVVSAIWTLGGHGMAIRAYKQLLAAGVPKSTNMMLLGLKLHAHSSEPEAMIGIFDELRKQLAATDFHTLRVPTRAISALVMTLIEKRDVDAAQQAFDFLLTLPIPKTDLPFTPLLRYYINHRMPDRLSTLLSRLVQHDIPLDAAGIDCCCNYFAASVEATDFANFLRYLDRSQTLDRVSDSLFTLFFTTSAAEYRVVDFEWALDALIKLNRPKATWRAIVDQLGKNDPRILSTMVHAAVRLSTDKLEMARMLLLSSIKSEWRAVVADAVLTALHEHKAAASSRIYQLALSAVVATWNRVQRLAASDSKITKEFLASVLDRNLESAIAAGIGPQVICHALLVISLTAPTGVSRCLEIMQTMDPRERRVQHYGAAARGCKRFKSIAGINAVREEMLRNSVAPTAKLLNNFMACYATAAPQSMSYMEEVVTRPEQQDAASDSESLEPLALSNNEADDDALFANLSGIRLHQVALERVMSVWNEFARQGLTPTHETYTLMLQALSNARKFTQGERLISELLASGLGHNQDTVYQWIRLRMLRGDIKGALCLFRAIGNTERCEQLARNSSLYRGLQKVSLEPKHFAIFIHRYLSSEEPDKAMRFFCAMHELGFRGQPWIYSLMLNTLANADRRDLFVETMKRMAASKIPLSNEVMRVVREYSQTSGLTRGSDPRKHW